MWCEWCAKPSYSLQTTVKITRDGHEVVVQYCGHCLRKFETEYFNGPTVRFSVVRAKRPAKRHS